MTWKPDYLLLAEAKAFLRIGDAIDDTEIAGWITSASRAVDRACNRQFGQLAAPAVRTYERTPFYDRTIGLWTLQIDDVQDVTAATVNGVAFASTGAVMLPRNAPADSKPWTRIGFAIQPAPVSPGAPILNTLSFRWGWTAVPAQVPMACKLQINRWAARRDSPLGVAGSPEQGSELRLLARLDPDVATVLMGLTRARRPG